MLIFGEKSKKLQILNISNPKFYNSELLDGKDTPTVKLLLHFQC